MLAMFSAAPWYMVQLAYLQAWRDKMSTGDASTQEHGVLMSKPLTVEADAKGDEAACHPRCVRVNTAHQGGQIRCVSALESVTS
jgi:hypothetical protein